MLPLIAGAYFNLNKRAKCTTIILPAQTYMIGKFS